LERLERGGNGEAALDLRTQLGQGQLDRCERARDVEDVEPPDVADAEDLPLQMLLAGGERDAVAVAQVPEELVGVDPVRRTDGRDDGRRVVVGREQLETHRLDAGAGRTTEADMTLERRRK